MISAKIKRKREKVFYLLLIPSMVAIGTFLLLISVLLYNSIPAFQKLGISIYTTNIWNPSDDKYGGLAAIYGTLITAGLSIIFSIPFSLSLAIFINDIAPVRLKSFLTNLSDLLASFPTVVYGFWGLLSLGPFLSDNLFNFLYNYLGFLPLFSYRNTSGPSILLAAIVLTFMITPFASSLLRETYSQVPRYIEEAVYSLGLGKWELIRIKISYIKRSFLGAYALAFGRATGETVAVSLTIGNILNLSPNLLAPGYTIS
ncbi:MAG: phosphate ABC transporter permease subunit PstC, partial [Sulfolobaceae archaeon]